MESEQEEPTLCPAGITLCCIQSVLFLFAIIFILFPPKKLGRGPATGAIAISMVMSHQITSNEALYVSIDYRTLVFLCGMMIITICLNMQKINKLITSRMQHYSKKRFLWTVCLGSGILSALITNDATCILLTPVVLDYCFHKDRQWEPHIFLMALCTSSNIGSAATLTGNPQNVLIQTLGSIGWLDFFIIAGPAALLCLILNGFFLQFYLTILERKGKIQSCCNKSSPENKALLEDPEIDDEKVEQLDRDQELLLEEFEKELIPDDYIEDFVPPLADRRSLLLFIATMIVLIGTTVAFILPDQWIENSWAAGAAAVILIFLQTYISKGVTAEKMIKEIDWSVLLFFAAIFIITNAWDHTGIPGYTWYTAANLARGPFQEVVAFALLSIILSNLVGNVPVVLLLSKALKREYGWIVLSWSCTVAGNLALTGSAANVIVDELYKKHRKNRKGKALGAIRHFYFGAPTTLILVSIGLVVIYGISSLVEHETEL